MSDTRQGDDWWMATDGKWYPSTSHPSNWPNADTRPEGLPTPPPAPAAPVASMSPTITYTPPPAPAVGQPVTLPVMSQSVDPLLKKWRYGSGYSQLTSVLVGVGLLGIAAAVAAIAIAFNAAEVMDQFTRTPVGTPAETRAIADWESAEGLLIGAGLGVRGLWAVLALLSIFWLYRAYRTVETTGAKGRQWSPGWAIAGFLIPVANLIMPFLMTSETAKVASSARIARETDSPEEIQNWRSSPTNFLILLWWFGFVGMLGFEVAFSYNLSVALAGDFSNLQAELDTYRQAYVFAGIGSLCAGVAFGALIRVAHEIRLDFRAASSDPLPGQVLTSQVAAPSSGAPPSAPTTRADYDLTSTTDLWRASRRR